MNNANKHRPVFSISVCLSVCTAVVLLEIAVESVSLNTTSASGRSEDTNDEQIAYIRAICDFRRLVLADYDGVLSDVKRSLSETYSCSSVQSSSASRPTDGEEHGDMSDGSSILLELRQPRDRLVSLQCDHSSGHLGHQLQRLLANKNVVEYLRLSELALTTDIRSIEWNEMKYQMNGF